MIGDNVIRFLTDVKRARKHNKLTLVQLADRCGTSKSNIHALEAKTQEPKLGLALKLANELGLSFYDY